jgi:hypothetical protein
MCRDCSAEDKAGRALREPPRRILHDSYDVYLWTRRVESFLVNPPRLVDVTYDRSIAEPVQKKDQDEGISNGILDLMDTLGCKCWYDVYAGNLNI